MVVQSHFRTNIHVPPIVIVPESVLKTMAAESERFPEPETGESMVGIKILPGENDPFREPIFFILGTIPAGSAIRQTALFELGGEFQSQVFEWLSQNWEAMREHSRPETGYSEYRWLDSVRAGFIPHLFDRRLSDLGDWHKHPGGMTHPSGGDLQTAIHTLTDPELNVHHMIAPIVTTRQTPDRFMRSDALVQLESGTFEMKVSFNYLSRRMLNSGMRNFISVEPHVVPDAMVPLLPALSWDLVEPDRMSMELRLLREYGCQVRTYYRETRGGPPLEVCFEIKRTDHADRPWDYELFIETQVGYPAVTPAIRVIKEENPEPEQETPEPSPRILSWLRDAVEKTPLYRLPQFQRQSDASFIWGPECTIMSLVYFLEKAGKVWKEEPITVNGTE